MLARAAGAFAAPEYRAFLDTFRESSALAGTEVMHLQSQAGDAVGYRSMKSIILVDGPMEPCDATTVPCAFRSVEDLVGLERTKEGPHALQCLRSAAGPLACTRLKAVLTTATCVNACGKLPT